MTSTAGLQPLPPMTRGCLLAEQMGLGKTIETVALILCNPRSAQGVGKKVSEHVMATSLTIEQLDEVAAAGAGSSGGSSSTASGGSTQALSSTQGVKLHTPLGKWHGGTLVVCMVSLVGQWIDEIQSKLSGDASW
jgi:SNF2 family DNA or RNA helicase